MSRIPVRDTRHRALGRLASGPREPLVSLRRAVESLASCVAPEGSQAPSSRVQLALPAGSSSPRAWGLAASDAMHEANDSSYSPPPIALGARFY